MPIEAALSDLVKEAAALFSLKDGFFKLGYKADYDKTFNQNEYKTGDEIKVKLDNFIVGNRGDNVASETLTEAAIPLVFKQKYNASFDCTSGQLQRDISSLTDQFVVPAARRLHSMFDQDVTDEAGLKVTHAIGDGTAFLNSWDAVDEFSAALNDFNAMDYSRYFALDNWNAHKLKGVTDLRNSFLPNLNKELTIESKLGRLADFDFMQNNRIKTHTNGNHATSGTIQINTAVSAGSSIILKGLVDSVTTFKAGDRFKISNVYKYDGVNRKITSEPLVLTVQQDVSAAAVTAALTVYPALVSEGQRQNFIVEGALTNEIPADADVTFLGGTSATFVQNIAFTERALLIASPVLPEFYGFPCKIYTDKDSGFSMRLTHYSDPDTNKQKLLLDMQAAIAWVPDQAILSLNQRRAA